ncbi:hypothetical protein KUCAC02_020148 [Chaenocephalus aceratus]|uniref:Uncharacterized protein n=1 Tax=Chaenocephalus aceratus TaxID=36190 RepID=A0ACB9VRT2_CHAAC|nr:hypothetical protein KUCAC02_020148 [Chaenocephalus aceratus]
MGTKISFSSCWHSFLKCFKKPNQSDADSKRGERGVTVFVNPAADSEIDPDFNSKRTLPPLPAGDLYIAQYDYNARTEEDLSFRTGDTLEALDKCAGDWWFAKALNGVSAPKKGYIPANYVAPVESIDAEPWYFPDTKRLDAEKMLLAEGNQQGAFLIRNCESQRGERSLSVLDCGKVKHYKLKKLDNGHVFVSRARSFLTVQELVAHYSQEADGLCVRLGEPCKKMEAPQTHGLSYNTVDQWEIDRKLHQAAKEAWRRTVWRSVRRPVERDHSSRSEDLKPGTMDSEDFLREAQIMKRLRHAKLIQLYAVCTMEQPIYIITELMKNGSLLDYLQEDKGAMLGISDQIEMAAQVASGMAYLELQNYIHRDLAARNVLVGENNICKVADFGLARVFMKENENVYEAKEGTKFPVKWTAPEAMHDNKFSIKSDVWSFGILLYEIMTFGQMPYPAMTNYQVVQRVPQGYRMPCPPNCPKVMYDMMMDCWKQDEPDRPTFETLQWKLEDFFDMDVTSYDDAARY